MILPSAILLGLLATAETPQPASDCVSTPQISCAQWVYPFPRPDEADLPAESAMPEEEDARARIAQMRQESEKIIDGYARQIENCHFEATLHFDEPERPRLIGNDQACQNRYRRMINEERHSLKRRISQFRLEHGVESE